MVEGMPLIFTSSQRRLPRCHHPSAVDRLHRMEGERTSFFKKAEGFFERDRQLKEEIDGLSKEVCRQQGRGKVVGVGIMEQEG